MRPMPETFTCTLTERSALSGRVQRLRLSRTDGQAFGFLSGQWVSLALPLTDVAGRPLRRSYSVASAPTGTPHFELAVTLVENGPGSTFLHQAPLGTTLEVKGPQGGFTRDAATAQPSLYVATGTGVAPLRGMLHDAIKAGKTEALWVLFGVRTVDDVLFADEWQAAAEKYPWFQLHLSLSQPPVGWLGRAGYVQEHVLSLWDTLARTGVTPHAYICGVKKMVLEVRDRLKQHGVERQQLHLETYD
jgi:CDP-4-dehydro-6-deoxyglucose reductase, E3